MLRFSEFSDVIPNAQNLCHATVAVAYRLISPGNPNPLTIMFHILGFTVCISLRMLTYFLNHPDMLQKQLADMEMLGCNHQEQSRERIVCDLIATMTDRNALDLYERIFFPSRLV